MICSRNVCSENGKGRLLSGQTSSCSMLWPPWIRCLFLGMLLSCGHQSYLWEVKKGLVSPLFLLTQCNVKYQHMSTGERNGDWLIMATLKYSLSSLGTQAPGAEDDCAVHSLNACSSSLLLPRGSLEIPPQTLCNPSVKAAACLALIADWNLSRRLCVHYHGSAVLSCQLTAKPACGAEATHTPLRLCSSNGRLGSTALAPFTSRLWGHS